MKVRPLLAWLLLLAQPACDADHDPSTQRGDNPPVDGRMPSAEGDAGRERLPASGQAGAGGSNATPAPGGGRSVAGGVSASGGANSAEASGGSPDDVPSGSAGTAAAGAPSNPPVASAGSEDAGAELTGPGPSGASNAPLPHDAGAGGSHSVEAGNATGSGIDFCDEDIPCLDGCSISTVGSQCTRVCTNLSLDRLAEYRCQIIEGSLSIGSSPTGLESLREITTDLYLEATGHVDLSGLSGLHTVGNSLYVVETEIDEVRLPGLRSVAGLIAILDNPALTTVEFDALQSVNAISIANNDSLASLRMPSLTCLLDSDWFAVHDNPMLPQGEVDAIAERVTGAACR